jgi:hypothetical protein
METEEGTSGALPTSQDDEFRPFIRRCFPISRHVLTVSGCPNLNSGTPQHGLLQLHSFVPGSHFSIFRTTLLTVANTSVYYPILVLYFCILFVLTMKRQIQHMIKYNVCISNPMANVAVHSIRYSKGQIFGEMMESVLNGMMNWWGHAPMHNAG